MRLFGVECVVEESTDVIGDVTVSVNVAREVEYRTFEAYWPINAIYNASRRYI